MLQTTRLKIYPISDDEMKHLIKEEPVPALKKAYQEMLNGALKYPSKRIWYALWNIELNDNTHTLVGHLSFKGLEKDGILEIGYGTLENYEGKGYMTEAVTAVTKWAVCQKGVTRIEAETEENNIASQRVLEKSGFVPNGQTGDEGPRYTFLPHF